MNVIGFGRESRVSLRERRIRLKGEGLDVARLDLVGRYVAAAQGPPPRGPRRFWIGGAWVDIDAAPAAAPADGNVVETWAAVPDLPIYRWVVETEARHAEHPRAVPPLPRSFPRGSGVRPPIGRRASP